MPGTVSHVLSATTPDDPSFEIRPSHWNSSHLFTLNASGSEISNAFANGGGVTFGYDGTNITAAAPAGAPSPVNFSAGTTSNNLASVVFSNSNGISFGLSGSTITGTVQTNYLTTAMASNRGTDFVQATAAFAGTSASGTINSTGISVSIGPYITTAMQSNAATISNIKVSGGTASQLRSDITFSDSNGISFGLGTGANAGVITATVQTNYLTTAMQSNAATISNIKVSAGTASQLRSDITLNDSNGISFGLGTGANAGVITATVKTDYQSSNANYLTSQSNQAASASNGSFTFQTLGFSNANNVTFGTSAGSIITASVAPPGAAAESNWHNLLGNNTAGNTTASGSTIGLSGINLTLSGTNDSQINISAPATSSLVGVNGVSISTNGSTISIGQQILGGSTGAGAAMVVYEPFPLMNATVTTTGGLNTLNLVPIYPFEAITFDAVCFIGSGAVSTTSVGNTQTVSLNGASSVAYSAGYSVTNSMFQDIFLFSRLTGGSTTNIGTFASTRNTFVTFYNMTHSLSATAGGANSSGSVSDWESLGVTVSYPMVTSATSTSVNALTTLTVWGQGYTTWTSSANTSSTNTWNSTTTGTISAPSTYPATTAWSSNKMILMPFATSLSDGEYWFGWLRGSSTSSSSQSGSTNGAAGRTFTVVFNASNLTQTGRLSYAGNTVTIASSLGWLGFASQNSMAPSPGHGSFSATFSPASTYVNNAGQANGVIALSDIRTDVSFFRTWLQFNNDRV